jgi:hypothetical protein
MLPADVTVYDVIDYSVDVTPTTNDDTGTYLSLFNVDEAYATDYIFQVLVTKPLTSFTTVNCEPFNVLDGAQIGQTAALTVGGRNVGGRNVGGRNVGGRNPVPIDGDFDAQTLQNTSFTMGSSTPEYLPSGSGTGSQTNLGCPGGWGRLGECTLAAPRLPNTVTVTLRAYQITPSPTRIFNPDVAPPAVGVAEYACKTSDCLAATGPDLAAPDPPANPATTVSPTDVDAGSLVTFPTSSVTVTNIGKDCANGDPCGTAQAHRWGIYLSTSATAANLPRYAAGDACPSGDQSQCVPGMIKENLTDFTKPVTTLLATGDLAEVLAAGTEIVAPQSVRIPSDIPRLNADQTGTYYAYLYIDDQRVVSELDEGNNIVQGGPITVRAGAYGIAGLFTPCGPGLTCNRSGTGAVPLAWQFTQGGVAVDTLALRPTLIFYQSNTSWQQGSQIGSAVSPCAAGTICDLSTGNSGFQYCDATATFALCSTRPPFTWQYNWQRKDPSTGQNLLGTSSCGSADADADVSGRRGVRAGRGAIGPIKIALQ